MFLPREAEALAERYLAALLPIRWRHVKGVGRKAAGFAPSLDGEDGGVLESAAWLHDIGYSPAIVDTGFHPLDGARFLREAGVDDRITCLVAHHTCALVEAEERGLAGLLSAAFDREESLTADLLWLCDLTVGPNGEQLSVPARLAEIDSRYGSDHLVARSIARARPELLAAVDRAERFLSADQPR